MHKCAVLTRGKLVTVCRKTKRKEKSSKSKPGISFRITHARGGTNQAGEEQQTRRKFTSRGLPRLISQTRKTRANKPRLVQNGERFQFVEVTAIPAFNRLDFLRRNIWVHQLERNYATLEKQHTPPKKNKNVTVCRMASVLTPGENLFTIFLLLLLLILKFLVLSFQFFSFTFSI